MQISIYPHVTQILPSVFCVYLYEFIVNEIVSIPNFFNICTKFDRLCNYANCSYILIFKLIYYEMPLRKETIYNRIVNMICHFLSFFFSDGQISSFG